MQMPLSHWKPLRQPFFSASLKAVITSLRGDVMSLQIKLSLLQLEVHKDPETPK